MLGTELRIVLKPLTCLSLISDFKLVLLTKQKTPEKKFHKYCELNTKGMVWITNKLKTMVK
jgi:hypothetical protein